MHGSSAVACNHSATRQHDSVSVIKFVSVATASAAGIVHGLGGLVSR